MVPATAADPVPLHTDADGVIRVAGTRVTLDTVVAAYRKGETPEQIAQDYSSLQIADIYAVIAYYLRHQDEVAAYLEARGRKADAARRKFQTLFPSAGLRERLQKRLR
jgi:uncharacterized protein (DUF433 family)